MKLLLFLNQDIHSLTALNFLFPALKEHQVKIVLSQKIGSLVNLESGIVMMKEIERNGWKDFFKNFDDKDRTSKKIFTFEQVADFFGTKVLSYENVNSKMAIDDFKGFAPDLIISIRFGQIFKQELINIPHLGVLNLHSGLLPKYRGVMASFWAILNGEKKLNTTLHYISDSKIDAGDIIDFSEEKIDWNSSLFLNINNLYKGGCDLIVKALRKISDGEEIAVFKQKDFGDGGYFSYPNKVDLDRFLQLMPLFEKDDARIAFDKVLEVVTS